MTMTVVRIFVKAEKESPWRNSNGAEWTKRGRGSLLLLLMCQHDQKRPAQPLGACAGRRFSPCFLLQSCCSLTSCDFTLKSCKQRIPVVVSLCLDIWLVRWGQAGGVIRPRRAKRSCIKTAS